VGWQECNLSPMLLAILGNSAGRDILYFMKGKQNVACTLSNPNIDSNHPE